MEIPSWVKEIGAEADENHLRIVLDPEASMGLAQMMREQRQVQPAQRPKETQTQ